MKNFLKNLSMLKILCIIVAVFLVVEIISWLPQLGMKATELPKVTSSALADTIDAIEVNKTDGEFQLVAEEGGRELYVNPANMDIRVVDKATGTYWSSVSDTDESDTTVSGPISITYIDGAGAEQIWNGYDYSIKAVEDEDADAKKKYTIERIPNGFRATMRFASEESTNLEEYMPKIVSAERYNEYFVEKPKQLLEEGKITQDDIDNYNKALEMIYALSDDESNYYNKFSGTPPVNATKILIELSKNVGYTVDMIREDSQQYDFTFKVTENPDFTIPVEFTLDNGDLVVNIPTGQITDNTLEGSPKIVDVKTDSEWDYKIKSIHVLPNFGLVKAEEADDGFIFVPDGSGALFDINSFDGGYTEYSRPVYDNTYYDTLYEQSEFRENVTMPVFGLGSNADRKLAAEEPEKETSDEEVAEGEEAGEEATEESAEETADTAEDTEQTEELDAEAVDTEEEEVPSEEPAEEDATSTYNGFMGIIESGDITAAINVKLAASGSVAADSPYNKVYPSFDLMQISNVKVFGPYSDNDARFMAKTDPFDFDCRVRYKLYTDNANYYTMSQSYRDYIISAYNLQEKKAEDSTAPKIYLDVIGALTIDARIVGVPYDKTVSMTTYDQLAEIYEDLADVNPVVSYSGVFNGGIYNTINDKAKLVGKNGSKADLEKLVNDKWDSLYLNIQPTQVYKTTSSFKPKKHALINFDGDALETYDYDIPSGEFDMTGSNGFYTVAPKYLMNVVSKFNSAASAYKNLSIGDLGNLYYENLKESDQCNPYQGEMIINSALETLAENRSLVLENPNANRIKYAAIATDISRESSDYGLIKENVPFRQLVFNGLLDYTTLSVNTASSNTDYFTLQAVELASFPKYTITYSGVSELKKANYNKLFATEYSKFAPEIKAQSAEISEAFAKIGTTRIKSHRVLANKVYETTYETGVKVITNYNTYAVKNIDVDGQTINLDAQKYIIIDGGDK